MKPTLQITTLAFLTLVLISMPAIVRAASTSDMATPISPTDSQSNNNNDNQNQTSADQNNQSQPIILTATPEKDPLPRGATQTILITAKSENGTALPDVNIASVILDYATAKQKLFLGGQTDDKGEVKVSAQIGPHSKPGQFLVTIVGEHDGFKKSAISTGFAVTDSGSGSGSSSDSKTKCSGSSCR